MVKKLLLALVIFSAAPIWGQGIDTLVPLVPQVIPLDKTSPSTMHAFEAKAGEVWSFTAQAQRFEIVDTVIRLYDPSGNLLLENDNESRTSTDARLEAWTAPTDGIYQIEVALEGEERAPTAGTAVLMAIPGYSTIAHHAFSPTLNATTLAPSPMDIRLHVEALNAGFNLISEGWQLAILPDGWRFQVNGEAVLNPVFEGEFAFGEGDYHFLIQPGQFLLMVEDVPVVTILRELPMGTVSIAGTAQPGELLATTPFYLNETAIPPISPRQRLYAPPFNPLAVMAELAELGYEVESGGLTLRVPRGLIETANTGFSLYPLSTGNDVQNFVLSFEGRMVESGAGTACGMTFRQVDSENFAAVMFSEDGNLYILQYEGGELLEQGLATQSIWIDPTENRLNWVVLVVQNDLATVYINGRLAGQSNVKVQQGALQISVFLNEPVYTLCTLDNLWLWELE